MFKKKNIPVPTEHYPLIIISDLHLGIDNKACDLLCAFLRHTTCDKLILNGDIIDGKLIDRAAPTEFLESYKRVMDAINRKIAEGTEVVYIPGNHDVKLRQMGIFGQKLFGVQFEKTLDFTDPNGKRFLIAHGDVFDPRKNPHAFPRIRRMAENAYVGVRKIGATVDKAGHVLMKQHFMVVARAWRGVGRRTGIEDAFEKAATDYARKKGYDGVICGHIHIEGIKERDGTIYMNSGDWVDSYTALTMNDKGEWKHIKWADRIHELGLKRQLWTGWTDNPDKAFRPATEKMLETVRKIWPGKPPKKPKPPSK